MKKYLYILLASITLFACQKDDGEVVVEVNSIANDLKSVIDKQGVEALQSCCISCVCTQSLGWGTDYSFEGDNFVRIQSDIFNLNQLVTYKVDTIGSTEKEVRLILYFNR